MSRAAWHFLVDIALLFALLMLAWTSSLLQFVFPPPTQASGYSLWGWDYDRWSDVRFGSLCLFLATALLHVMLQWDWVCNFIASRLSRLRREKVVVPKAVRTIYGVGTLIVLLTFFCILLAVAEFTINPGE